jgi:hypothetical protein
VQAQTHLGRLAGEHGVHRAEEIAQVVGGSDQPARQVELAFG